MPTERRITDLPALISGLPPEDRALADRIFGVSATTGRLDPPEAMHDWIERSFGSVEAVREQRVVKVTNRITLEGALFNELRASRPLDTGVNLDLEYEIEKTAGDPFCRPAKRPPAGTFGRAPPPPTPPSTAPTTSKTSTGSTRPWAARCPPRTASGPSPALPRSRRKS